MTEKVMKSFIMYTQIEEGEVGGASGKHGGKNVSRKNRKEETAWEM